MFRIYTKEKRSREVHSINLTADEVNLILKGNYFKDCPEWNEDNAVVVEKEYFYPTWTGTELREMTQEELKIEGIVSLEDGEYIQDGQLIKVEYDISLGYLKPTWNKEAHVWYEGATEEEITEHMGVLVTKLLYEALSIGCEVTVNGEKHQQTLADEKRRALLEKVSGIDLKIAAGREATVVPWPFKDDGTDTVIMSVEDFRTMALYCFDYGDNCYIAAEFLKAKRKINSTLEDFYSELANVDGIALENL